MNRTMGRFGQIMLCAMMMLAGIAMISACASTPKETDPPAMQAAPATQAAPAAAVAKDDMLREIAVQSNGELWAPGIAIDLAIEDAIREKLLARGETAIVSYMIEVYPEDPVPGYDDGMGSDGSLNLVVDNHEITVDNPHVVIHHAVVDRGLYEALSDRDRANIQMLINVYSGRHSDDGNILDCGIVQGPLMENSAKAHTVACGLLMGAE